MKKIIYKIFGNPIAPKNLGVIGTNNGRLYIDKRIFFMRKDVQEQLKRK